MKSLFKTLLLTSAALLPYGALAQDDVADLLSQPSTVASSISSGISRPVNEAPVVVAEEQPVKAPVTNSKKAQPIVDDEPAVAPVVVEAPVAKAAPVSVTPAPVVKAETVVVAPAENIMPQASMLEVLARAYASSPTLKAERENLRIQYEEIAQADALRRPDINADAGIGAVYINTDPGNDDTTLGKDIGLSLVQPVWAGGRFSSYIDQQLRLSDAAIAAYESVGQQVFLNVIAAAMDIVRDRATIDLNEKNYEVIAEQLSAAEKGFEVGELTRTDVSQAKARLAGADASLTAAKAAYQSSLARFTQFAGMDGTDMDFAHDAQSLNLPTDLQAAQSLGDTANPEIIYAMQLQTAAGKAVDVARGELYPLVTLVGTTDQDWDPSPTLDNSTSASLGLRASMNLYEGGAAQSRIRQAKISQYEKDNRVEEAQRSVRQQVATAWNNHNAARAQIAAFQAQVDAATIARNGVYKEREVGLRTVLDTLDAERELLNAQVGLVQAERDVVVTDYALLAATGQLTPSKLGVFAQNAEQGVIKETRRHLAGTSVAPRD